MDVLGVDSWVYRGIVVGGWDLGGFLFSLARWCDGSVYGGIVGVRIVWDLFSVGFCPLGWG